MTERHETVPRPRHLGDGLVLRPATIEDAEQVAEFISTTFDGTPESIKEHRHRTLMRMSGQHPLLEASDFVIVEDTQAEKVVSSLCLISQEWSYGGIPFGVGQVESVVTHPDYRRRGLVRAMFGIVHRRSAERGQLVTALDGLPWFYRQFGYEMAIGAGGGRVGYPQTVPPLSDGESEHFRFRPATYEDLPFLLDAAGTTAESVLLANVRSEKQWKYVLDQSTTAPHWAPAIRVVEDLRGVPIGVLVHGSGLEAGALIVFRYLAKSGVSWLAMTPSVMRYLLTEGQDIARREGQALNRIRFELGQDHPAYAGARDYLPGRNDPYAWYVRVPDLPGFLRHVAPSLERRLAGSVAAGHTGEVKITFVNGGLRLVLESGRLVEIEPWDRNALVDRAERDGIFPGQVFLQMVFGYRSVTELEHSFADCGVASDRIRALLDALFPKLPSLVQAVHYGI